MSFKDQLLRELRYDEEKIVRAKRWIDLLDQEGFDWDNVTPTQEWAIRNHKLPDN